MHRITSTRIVMLPLLLVAAGAAHSAFAADLSAKRPSVEQVDQIRQAIREGRLDPRVVTLADAIDEVILGLPASPRFGPYGALATQRHDGVTGNPNPWAGIIDISRDFHEGFERSLNGAPVYNAHVSLADAADYRPLAGQIAPNGNVWGTAPAYTGIVDNATAQTGPNWGLPDGRGDVHGGNKIRDGAAGPGPDPNGDRSDFLAVPRGTISPQASLTNSGIFQARITHDIHIPTQDESVFVIIDFYTDNIDSFNWWRPVSFLEGSIVTNVFIGGYDFSDPGPWFNPTTGLLDRFILLGPKTGSINQGEFFMAPIGHVIQDREWMNLCLRISLNSFSAWVRDSTTVGVYGFPGDGDGTFIAPHGEPYKPTDYTQSPMDQHLKDGWYQFFPGYPNDPTSSRIEGNGPARNHVFTPAQQTQDEFGYPAGPLLFTQSVDALQFIAGGDPLPGWIAGFQPKDSYIDNYTVIGPRYPFPDPIPDERIPFFDDMELWPLAPIGLLGTAWFDYHSSADIVNTQNHTAGGAHSVRQVGIHTDGVYREHYRRRLPRALADTSTPTVIGAYFRRSNTNMSRGVQPADSALTGDWFARVIMGGRDDNYIVDNRVYARVPNPNYDPNLPDADISGANVIHLNGLNTPFVNVPLFNAGSPIGTPTNTWFEVRMEVLANPANDGTGTLRVFINGVEGAPDGSVEGVTALTTNALSADSLRIFGGNELNGFLNQLWLDDISVDGPRAVVPTPITAGDNFLPAQPGFPYTTHPAFATPYTDDFESYESGRALGGQSYTPFLGALYTEINGELDVLAGDDALLGAVPGVTSVYRYLLEDVIDGAVPGGHTPGTIVAVVNNIPASFIPSSQPVPGSPTGAATKVNFRENNPGEARTGRAEWSLQSMTPSTWNGADPIVGRYWLTYATRWASAPSSEVVANVAGGLRDGAGQAIRFQRPGSGAFTSLLPRTPAARSGESSSLAFDLYIHSDNPGDGPRNRITWNVNAAGSVSAPPQITAFTFGGPNNFEDNYTLNTTTTTGEITAAPDGLPDNFDGRAFQSDPTKLYVLRTNPIGGFGAPPFMLQQDAYTVPMNTWVRASIDVNKVGAWTARFDDGVTTHTVTGTALQGNATGSNVRQLERLQFEVAADAGGDGGPRLRPIVFSTLPGGATATPEGGFDPLPLDAGTGSFNTTRKYLYYEISQFDPPSFFAARPTVTQVHSVYGVPTHTRAMEPGDVVAMWNDEGTLGFGGAGAPVAPIAADAIPRNAQWEYSADGGATRSVRGTWIPLGLPGDDGVDNPAPKGGITAISPPYHSEVPYRTLLMATMIDGRNLPVGAPTFPPSNISAINEPRYPDQIDGAGDPWRAWVDNLELQRTGCFADVNGDGQVNGADLGLVLGAWGTNNPMMDLNDSGNVDGADLGLLLGSWGACP